MLRNYTFPSYLQGFKIAAMAVTFLCIAGTCLLATEITKTPPLVDVQSPPGWMAPPEVASFSIIGNCTTTEASDVFLSGGVAYVADGSSGLRCINVSNPATPTLLGTCPTTDALGVFVIGGIAYVADSSAGIRSINVSNPAAPILLDTYNTAGTANEVFVCGGVAYVADGDAGLQCLNVTNPADLVYLGSNNTPGYAYNVDVCGGVALVADGSFGLQCINVTDPRKPYILGNWTLANARDVEVSGSMVYVADYDYDAGDAYSGGLKCFNISNPRAPALLFSRAHLYFSKLHVHGTVLYVAVGDSLYCYDISYPADLPYLRSYSLPGGITGVRVDGGIAYVADSTVGLVCIQIAEVAVPPILIGTYDTTSARGVDVSGGVAYVADGDAGLRCINISNPRGLTLLATYNTPGTAQDVCVSAGVAYVADYTSGLQCINVSNPRTPALLGYYNSTAESAWGVCVDGGVAYLANGSGGLQCINISDPRAPALLGTWAMSDFANDVCVSGGIVYVADGDAGLRCINVSNPKAPALLGTWTTSGYAYDVCVSGSVAYVADSTAGLRCINITNPANPYILGTCPTFDARGVDVSGSMVYVADHTSGMRCINVSNPTNPSLNATYNTPGTAYGVCVSGGLAYVADLASGMQCILVRYYFWDLPEFVDLQPGDNTWRAFPGTTYDVDFIAGLANLSYAQYTICSEYGQDGTVLKDWTNIFTGLNKGNYTDNWTIDFAACQEGMNYVSVRVVDMAGALSYPSDVFYVKKETVPPTVTENLPGDVTWQTAPGATYDVDFTDTASYLSNAQYQIWSAGGQGGTLLKDWTYIFVDLNLPSYSTDWAIDFDACQGGTNYISVRVYDFAGNNATVIDVFSVRKDAMAPSITDNQEDNVTWQIAPGATYDVDFADAASNLSYAQYQIWSAAGQGGALLKDWTDIFSGLNANSYTTNWSIDYAACQEGMNFVSVRVVDYAGLETITTDVFYMRKDAAAPVIIDDQPGNDTWLSVPGAIYDVDFVDAASNLSYGQYQIWSAAGQGGALLKDWTDIFSGLNASNYTTNWSIDYAACQEGTNYVSVRAFDHLGHQGTTTDVFYVRKDTAAPTIQVDTPGHFTSAISPTISVTFQDAGSGIVYAYFKIDEYSPSGTQVWGWLPLLVESGTSSKTIEFTLDADTWAALDDGNHIIYFKAWDSLGNVAVGAEFAVEFVKDTGSTGDNSGGLLVGLVIAIIAGAVGVIALIWLQLRSPKGDTRSVPPALGGKTKPSPTLVSKPAPTPTPAKKADAAKPAPAPTPTKKADAAKPAPVPTPTKKPEHVKPAPQPIKTIVEAPKPKPAPSSTKTVEVVKPVPKPATKLDEKASKKPAKKPA